MHVPHTAPWVLLAATLAACSDPQATASGTSGAPATTTTARAPDRLTEPYVVKYVQTGGIAGLRMELTIDTAAKKVFYAGRRNNQPQTNDLTPEDLERLTRALEASNYLTFRGPLTGTPFPDAFAYALTIKVGGHDYSVSWTDGTTVPDSLSALRTFLVKLRNAKFPA